MGRARRGRNHKIAAPASPETPSSPFLLQNQQDSINHDVAPTAINDRLLQQYPRIPAGGPAAVTVGSVEMVPGNAPNYRPPPFVVVSWSSVNSVTLGRNASST